MSSPLPRGIPLEAGEATVRAWGADAVELDGMEGPRGWLILTNRRCLFARRVGALGSRGVLDPSRSVPLERIRYAGLRRFPMRIGIGEMGTVAGVELDGRGYRTGRAPPPGSVLVAIARQRLYRREELGLESDSVRCVVCGTDNFSWNEKCLHCGRVLRDSGPGTGTL
ncbi:MAG: hypothetical protein WA691_08660 [Thermoplasmata archaeon]